VISNKAITRNSPMALKVSLCARFKQEQATTAPLEGELMAATLAANLTDVSQGDRSSSVKGMPG